MSDKPDTGAYLVVAVLFGIVLIIVAHVLVWNGYRYDIYVGDSHFACNDYEFAGDTLYLRDCYSSLFAAGDNEVQRATNIRITAHWGEE